MCISPASAIMCTPATVRAPSELRILDPATPADPASRSSGAAVSVAPTANVTDKSLDPTAPVSCAPSRNAAATAADADVAAISTAAAASVLATRALPARTGPSATAFGIPMSTKHSLCCSLRPTRPASLSAPSAGAAEWAVLSSAPVRAEVEGRAAMAARGKRTTRMRVPTRTGAVDRRTAVRSTRKNGNPLPLVPELRHRADAGSQPSCRHASGIPV